MKKKSNTKKVIKKQSRNLLTENYPLFKNSTLIAILSITTLIFFFPLLLADFLTLDDQALILNKIPVLAENPSDIFTYHLFSPHYKPVVYLSWLIEYSIFGFNSFVFHLDNVLLHIINCILLFSILKHLLPEFEPTKRASIQIAFFVAIIYALHPIHLESVAWATERKDLLFSLFYFSSILTYQKFLVNRKLVYIILSAILFLPAILSKAPAITLPFVLFIIDYAYKRKWTIGLLVEKTGHILIFFLAIFLYGIFLKNSSEGIISDVSSDNILNQAPALKNSSTFIAKILIGSMKTVLWLLHIIFPFKLSVFYPRSELILSLGKKIYFFPFILSMIMALLFMARKKAPLLFFSGLWFGITLSPAIVRITQGTGIFLSDRYTYVPSVGVILFLAAHLYLYINKQLWSTNFKIGLLSILAIIPGIMTFTHSFTWQNEGKLWTNAIDKFPDNDFVYLTRAEYFHREKRYDEAKSDLQKSLKLNPRSTQAILEFGSLYYDLDSLEKAKVFLETMDLNDPKNNPYKEILAKTYQKLGMNDKALTLYSTHNNPLAAINEGAMLISTKKYEKAIEVLNGFIQRDTSNEVAYLNLGRAYYGINNYPEALKNYQMAIHLKDDYPFAHRCIGTLLTKTKDYDKAVQAFNTATELEPDNYINYFDIAQALVNQKKDIEAIEYFTKSIEKKPDFPIGHFNLGSCYYRTKQFTKAVELYEKATLQDPSYAKAFAALCLAHDALGQNKEAVVAKNRAVSLDPSFGKGLSHVKE